MKTIRKCSDCQETKTLENFYKEYKSLEKSYKNSSRICKDCSKERNRLQYSYASDYAKERKRTYQREYMRKYRAKKIQEDPEGYRAYINQAVKKSNLKKQLKSKHEKEII